MTQPRGHSNIKTESLRANDRTGAAMIPLEGGATVNSVRSLPPLALRREEWKTIGDRMNWFASPPNTNGGSLWIEFHDRGGRVDVNNLTLEGIQAAKYQLERMAEELETAQEKLDGSEV